MSRRDTIILAVLLNTGLLAVLFVIAINPESEHFTAPSEIRNAVVEIEPMKLVKEPQSVILAHENKSDEVDNVLKDFAATIHLDNAPTAVSPNRRLQFDEEMIAMHVEDQAPKVLVRREANTGDYPAQDYVEVTVKRGDILGRIAQANHTTVAAIKQVNQISGDSLQIGQVLRIPVGSKKEATSQIAATSPFTTDQFARYYNVQVGDNPWKIAKKFNVSVKELLQLNDLDEAKAKGLRPGDRIRVQ